MDATILVATCLQSCVQAKVPDVVEKKNVFSLFQPFHARCKAMDVGGLECTHAHM